MCAFVKYVELDSAINSYNAMQRAVIHGQHVKVGWGKVYENSWKIPENFSIFLGIFIVIFCL